MSELLNRTRDLIRTRHMSIRTEQAYIGWIREYILFHQKTHPATLGAKHVSAFLSHLAVARHVSASTQNQALSAILFLYREVLSLDLDWIADVERAQKPKRLPVVFTRAEVQSILARLNDTKWIMASLLYGSGLRLMECVRLRVKDLDFGAHQIVVRDGKGNKDRVTMLPQPLVEPLRRHWRRGEHGRADRRQRRRPQADQGGGRRGFGARAGARRASARAVRSRVRID